MSRSSIVLPSLVGTTLFNKQIRCDWRNGTETGNDRFLAGLEEKGIWKGAGARHRYIDANVMASWCDAAKRDEKHGNSLCRVIFVLNLTVTRLLVER
jgi:hypothetical protein